MTSSSLPRWQKLSDKVTAATPIFELRSATFHHPVRQLKKDFVVVHASPWVNIVALTPTFEIVLVKQFRFGTNDFSLEIPGGIMDPDEDASAAGLRELREETGYVGTRARVIGKVRPNPAFQDNWCSIVLIENAVRGAELEWDADEEIETLTRPVEEVFRLAREGKIDHSLVVAALFFFAPCWAEIKAPQSSAGV